MKKNISLFIFVLIPLSFLFAQKAKQIKGKVTDATTGMDIAGVGVGISGNPLSVTTDMSGNFSINVQLDRDSVLEFRFIGYDTQAIPIGQQDVVNVKLVQSNQSLEEVVVIGYGEVQRGDLTGSVGSVDVEDLQKAPVGSALEALAGR